MYHYSYVPKTPVAVTNLNDLEDWNARYWSANNTILITYSEFAALRCPIFIRRAIDEIQRESFFSNIKIKIYTLDVSRLEKKMPVPRGQCGQVIFAINRRYFELEECETFLDLRPEIKMSVALFVTCLMEEIEIKLRRVPQELYSFDDLQGLMSLEPIILMHIGETLSIRELVSSIDVTATYPLLFVTDWFLADKIAFKYRGKIRHVDKFCILKSEKLIDSHDPYQMPCMDVTTGTSLLDLKTFYINEKSKKVLMAPSFKTMFEHLQIGKSCAIYVKSAIYDSDKYRLWLKTLIQEDRSSMCYAVFNSTDRQLKEVAKGLNLTDYQFTRENIYLVYPGKENGGFLATRMRGNFSSWDFRRFIQSKQSDQYYDEIEQMELKNPNTEAKVGRLTLVDWLTAAVSFLLTTTP